MAVLVRYLTPARAGLWAEAGDDKFWDNGQFPYYLLQDLYEPRSGSGVSFFEAASRDDPVLIRIAAALHFPGKEKSKANVESVDFRTVDMADVHALGLTITATTGGTRDDEVNKLHREITDLTGPLAVALARLMAQSPNVVFSAVEVAGRISDGISKKYLDEKFMHPSMLHSLVDKGAAIITYKAA